MLNLKIECLKSLYFRNMDQREHLVERAATDTCKWLLNHQEYATWVAQPHALLWIVGKPGAGKSTLLRHALQEASHSNDVVASFFFFGRGQTLQKSSFGLFRSLLHQLLDQIPEMLSDFISIYKDRRETKRKSGSDCEWHETELREYLKHWLQSASRDRPIRIYVDALDEAGQDVAMKLIVFFQELHEQLHPTRAGFKTCFSCRHYPVLAPTNALKICVEEENHQDIATYVRQELASHQLSGPAQARMLEQEIIEKASDVFQWVVLIIPIIVKSDKDGASLRKIRQKIKEIPRELDDLYEHILSNIEDRKRAAQLVQWICFAVEPLSLGELRYAMMFDITTDFMSHEECQSSVDFAETDEQMRKTVNSLSGGLAETVGYEDGWTVRFIHQSVNDYFVERGLRNLGPSFFDDVNHYLSQSGLPNLENSFSDNVVALAHFRISRSCFKYVALGEIRDEVMKMGSLCRSARWDKEEELDGRFPFLRYSREWTSHAEIVERQQICQADLLPLSQGPSKDAPYSMLQCSHLTGGATLLHIASQHGLMSVIEAIIESGVSFDVNARDLDGDTSLSLAAARGQEAVVRLLIERDDIEVDLKGFYNRTPLLLAAKNGHEAIVQLLIERDDVDINSKDKSDQTPLSWAVENEHEAVVRLLLERDDVDINSKDEEGYTPFSWTARNGHEAIVRLLLERDNVDINSKDKEGKPPLSRATINRYEAIVRLLLERDNININSKDKGGNTPFSWAILWKHEAIVRLLLERDDVDINSKDRRDRTPLWWAAGRGYTAIVRLLLERDDIEIDSKDDNGQTALEMAIKHERKGVVKILEKEISRRRSRLGGRARTAKSASTSRLGGRTRTARSAST